MNIHLSKGKQNNTVPGAMLRNALSAVFTPAIIWSCENNTFVSLILSDGAEDPRQTPVRPITQLPLCTTYLSPSCAGAEDINVISLWSDAQPQPAGILPRAERGLNLRTPPAPQHTARLKGSCLQPCPEVKGSSNVDIISVKLFLSHLMDYHGDLNGDKVAGLRELPGCYLYAAWQCAVVN